MRVQYVADDGAVFNSPKDCYEHELTLTKAEKDNMPKCYTFDGEEVSEIVDSELVIITSVAQAKTFISRCDGIPPKHIKDIVEDGELPFPISVFYYDYYLDDFYMIDKYTFDGLNNIVKKLNLFA